MSLLTLFGSRGRTYRTDFSNLDGWTTEAGTLAAGLQASALADWLGNLVTNGEFTTDTTGWYDSGATSARVDSASDPGAASGGADAWALKITSNGGFPRTSNSWKGAIGYRYVLRTLAYAPSANARTNAALMTFVTAASIRAQVTAEDVWQEISTVSAVLTIADEVMLAPRDSSLGGTSGDIAYFDKVQVYRANAVGLSPHRQANGVWTWTLAQPATGVVPFSMLLRYSDASNYWEVRTKPNTTGIDLELWEVAAGVEALKDSGKVGWTAGGTDRVRVTALGNAIDVEVMLAGETSYRRACYWGSATHNATAAQYGTMLWGTGVNRASNLEVTRAFPAETDDFKFQVVPTAGATLSLAVERHNTALDAVTWVWPDGTTSTGDSVSKLLPVAGAQWVTLRVPQPSNLRRINFASQPVRFSLAQVRRYTALQRIDAHSHASTVITGTLADLPAGMLILYLYSTASVITGTLADLPAGMLILCLYNTASVITGTLADLPAGMLILHLYNTASVITGTLADLPATMQILYLYTTASVITGTLADLPATMQILHLYNTASVITGGGSVGATALRDLRINSLGLSTAQVDEIIDSIWASRNAFTWASNIRLDIHGSNGAPTGTVANVCPPTTPAEKLYNLRHVQCGGDTHKPWSPITFTGGAL